MIDQFQKYLAQLGDLSPAAFCGVILMLMNLMLRRTPGIPNWSIPWISVLVGMILFPVFLPLTTHFQNPLGRNIGLGFIVGCAAAIGYNGIVRFAEKKWPWLHDIITGPMEETTQILLVENDPLDVELMLHKLGKCDVEVHLAKSGSEAVRMLDARHYHFIILDLKLNGVSGMDVQKHCNSRGIKTPIAVMTGLDPASADVAEARRLGAVAIINKDTVNERELKNIFETEIDPQI